MTPPLSNIQPSFARKPMTVKFIAVAGEVPKFKWLDIIVSLAAL